LNVTLAEVEWSFVGSISSHGELQFSELAERLCAGDPAAESLVVGRFTIQLVTLARRQLADRIRQKTSPEDAVQSAFKSFFKRLRRGQFDLGSWDGLWSLLALITVRKCAARRTHFLSARRDVRRETPLSSAFVNGDTPCIPVSRGPLPEEAAALIELVEQLLCGLSDGEQQIVQLRLQGYSIDEICQRLERADRTVRRVLARVRGRAMRLTNVEEGDSVNVSDRPTRATRGT
jgi:RNA polymerase sigma-70 factor (ECF subfamily)